MGSTVANIGTMVQPMISNGINNIGHNIGPTLNGVGSTSGMGVLSDDIWMNPEPKIVQGPVGPQGPPGQQGIRGTFTYCQYVGCSGAVYQGVDLLPQDGGSEPHALVAGDGIYRYMNGKWKKNKVDRVTLFYDKENMIFYSITPNKLDAEIQEVTLGTGITVRDGDILVDGHCGQFYIHANGKWYADPRCNLGSIEKKSTIMKTNSNMTIPNGIQTILADTSSGSLTLTLPKSRSVAYRTPLGIVNESARIDIVNIGSKEVKIRVQDPDKLATGKTISKSDRATYQSHEGVWYVVA